MRVGTVLALRSWETSRREEPELQRGGGKEGAWAGSLRARRKLGKAFIEYFAFFFSSSVYKFVVFIEVEH